MECTVINTIPIRMREVEVVKEIKSSFKIILKVELVVVKDNKKEVVANMRRKIKEGVARKMMNGKRIISMNR